MRAVLPSEALAEAVGAVDGIDVEIWEGSDAPPTGEVAVWVAPYPATPPVIERAMAMSGLRVVQLQSAGFDGVPELLPAGVLLCNAQGVHDDATAEHAVGLILASLRGIPEAVRGHGSWKHPGWRRSLADSQVLILGHGSIGRAVAERLLPMKARVTAVASRPREDDLVGRVHGIDELPDLLPEADVVVVLVPLNEATRGLVDAAFLARMADGALLVNVARGPVVDTDAVIAEAGRLVFALDVTDPEPLPDDHPLWQAPGVLITPHIAGGTTAMWPRIGALVRDQLELAVRGDEPRNVVSGGPV